MSRLTLKNWIVIVVGLLIVALLIGCTVYLQQQRRLGNARSILINCEQIENIKKEIRTTTQKGIDRLPTIEYYQTRPEELKRAKEDSAEVLERFKPLDCFDLPVVKRSLTRRTDG